MRSGEMNRDPHAYAATLALVVLAVTGCNTADPFVDDPMAVEGKGDGDGSELIEKNLLWFDNKSGPSIVAEAMLRGLPGPCALGDLVPQAPQMWAAKIPSTTIGGVAKRWVGIEIHDFRARISPDGQVERMEAIDFLAQDFQGCEGEQTKTCRYSQQALLSQWEATITIDSTTQAISAFDVYFRVRGSDSYRYRITCP